MARIREVEIAEFKFTVANLGLSAESARAVYNIGYKPGGNLELTKYAVVIRSDDGAEGQYVTHWGGQRRRWRRRGPRPNLIGRDSGHPGESGTT